MPPRPVAFEPATTLTCETLQLHLQHKLTQRALAQFRSQAFGEDRLSRVTVVVDPTHKRSRVLSLARLSLYGSGASRLHEELIAAAAYWVQGSDPARLKPFETTEAEDRALESLSAVLSRPDQQGVPAHMVKTLMASALGDEEALWEKVKLKVLKRVVWAEEKLRQRAKVEAQEMLRVLEQQRSALDRELGKRSAAEKAKAENKQLALPHVPTEPEERAQYDADTKHISRRREALDAELAAEPERIRRLYDVKHYRVERIGLVYLWPSGS